MQLYKSKKNNKSEHQYSFEEGQWQPIVLGGGVVPANIVSHNCNFVRIDQFIYFTIELEGVQYPYRNRLSPMVSLPFKPTTFQHASGFSSKAYIHEFTDSGNPTNDPLDFDYTGFNGQEIGFLKLATHTRSFNNGGNLKVSGHFYSPYIKLK